MYTHKTLKRQRRTLRLQIKYPPTTSEGFVRTIIRNPPVLRIASCGRSRTGKGAIEDPPTGTMSPGWVPLAHAKGRQETGAGGAVSSGQSTR